ncbi:hypothetical protein FQN57_000114 [Myotisia sp. PD_48]|nr:hypothetical protein FQN57_000114 [Myotisia sp. PD_48]
MLDISQVIAKLSLYPKSLGTLVALGGPTLYLILFRRRLGRKIRHKTCSGCLADLPIDSIRSIPSFTIKHAHQTRAVYDRASLPVPTALLPSPPECPEDELLTRYLRRNMTCFSRLPQAFILRLACEAALRKTFQAEYIRKLDFEVGDVVCGGYKVAFRDSERVEFAMEQGAIQGRLVTLLKRRGEETEFVTQTVMWKPDTVTGPMPLDIGIVKWLHELTSWWMLSSGVRYLLNS